MLGRTPRRSRERRGTLRSAPITVSDVQFHSVATRRRLGPAADQESQRKQRERTSGVDRVAESGADKEGGGAGEHNAG